MTGLTRYKKSQRLAKNAIGKILASARVRRGRVVAVQVQFNDVGFARLGLIVPKRVLPRAVDRNRARRLLREWFRHTQTRLGARDLLVRGLGGRADLDSMTAELECLIPVE